MSEDKTPRRRSTHVEVAATYAAVGASQAADLMRFPPEGSTPFHEEVLLGSGEDRYVIASTSLMTWGAQRNAGITVEPVDEHDDEVYAGLQFSTSGVPEVVDQNEQQFAPDGTAFLKAGNVVRLIAKGGDRERQVRVVSTIEEPERVGFVIGSVDESGVTGEEFYSVEQRPDGTVWGIVRGFLKPVKEGVLGLKGKTSVKAAVASAREQIEALTPANTAEIASTQAGAFETRIDPETGKIIVIDVGDATPDEPGDRAE